MDLAFLHDQIETVDRNDILYDNLGIYTPRFTKMGNSCASHKDLLISLWGPAHVEDTAYLRVYINQLRQKLEADPATPRLIRTEPGVGYRLATGV